MKRNSILRSIVLISLIFYTLSTLSAKGVVDRPNIVWITSEDNSMHYMKLYDEGGVSTPNIESLADNGVVFNHAFSNAAVCSAARSTLISGCYGPRVSSHYHRRQQKVPMPDGIKMFPAYLRDAGYYTTNNSKEDYNIFTSEGVWDMSSREASWRNRAEGQPFFHVFNIGVCHESSMHFTEARMKSKKTTFNMESVAVQPNHPNTELFRYTNALYRDRISEMDRRVGLVLDELKKDNLLESTIIFYYGDHGGVLPGSKGYLYETGLHVPLVVYVPEKYRELGKFDLGSRTDAFVSFVDFGPTVLSLAGVKVPKEMDGKPFLGDGAKLKEIERRDETYSYADRFDEKYDMVRAVRKGKYKYIRSYQPFNYDGLYNEYRYKQLAYQEWFEMYKSGDLNQTQSAFFESREPELLFNVELDKFETNNLASDPAYRSILEELRANLISREVNMPDISFYPEHYLIKSAFENPVKFGEEHKQDIKEYITIASLQTVEFSDAEVKLREYLSSSDEWCRYWALIVCSTFGEEAKGLEQSVRNISISDSELINRVRAAEFLAIIKAESPLKVMMDALSMSKDENEALLILNSMVLMEGINRDVIFNIDLDKIDSSVKGGRLTSQRIKYLNR